MPELERTCVSADGIALNDCRHFHAKKRFWGSISFTGAMLATVLLLPQALDAQTTQSEPFSNLVQAAAADRDAGHTAAALREYQQAVNEQPQWAEGWWNLGVLRYQANQYTDAIVAFHRLTALHPEAGMAWSLLGLCEFATKNYAAALHDLQTGQSLGPQPDAETERVAAYHLALLENRSGAFTQAQQTLEAAFGPTGYPNAAKVALGLALLRVPLLPEEVNPARDALLHDAGSVAALFAQGDTTQALALFPGLLAADPEIPYLHLAYGKALATAKHPHRALLQMQAEEKISPQSALPWVEAAQLYIGLHQTSAALTAARRAVALDPKSTAALQSLAQALQANGETSAARKLRARAGSLPAEAPQREERLVQMYAAATAAPSGVTSATSPTELWDAAMQAYAQQKYAAAESLLQSWVVQHPQDGTAWAVLGLCEAATGDTANALLHLQQGRRLGLRGSPQAQQTALYQLAVLLNQSSQFDSATDVLAPWAATASPPMAEQAQIALGMAMLRIPKPPSAMPASEMQLLKQCGTVAELLQSSHYDAVYALLQTLLQQYPHQPFLHFTYGKALAALSHFNRATAAMQAETKISPHSALPWIWMARIALKQDDAAAALTAAQHAVHLAFGSAEAHYMLGRAEMQLGHADAALTELQTAAVQMPNSPEVHFALAQAYQKAHQPDKAEQERILFQNLHPASSGVEAAQSQ
jgi:tetratricopeptide (TPR) repeat protein